MLSEDRLQEIERNTVQIDCGISGEPLTMEMSIDDYYDMLEHAEEANDIKNKMEDRIERVMDSHTYLEGRYYKLKEQNQQYIEMFKRFVDIRDKAPNGYFDYSDAYEEVYNKSRNILEGRK